MLKYEDSGEIVRHDFCSMNQFCRCPDLAAQIICESWIRTRNENIPETNSKSFLVLQGFVLAPFSTFKYPFSAIKWSLIAFKYSLSDH